MFASTRWILGFGMMLVLAAPLLSSDPAGSKQPQNDAAGKETEPVGPMVRIEPRKMTVRPGEEFTLKLYANTVEDLRGYQLALKTPDEAKNPLAITAITIDAEDPEYVFAVDQGTGQEAVRQPSLERGMALSARFQGGVTVEKGYLATFKIRAPRVAGTLEVQVDKARSMMLNSTSEHIAFKPVAAEIHVGAPSGAAK